MMLKIIEILIDALLPPREEAVRIRSLAPTAILELFRPGQYTAIQYVATYSTPLGQALIKENKFHHSREAAKALARLLEHWLDKNGLSPVVLIPIPLSKQRLQSRGHNQVESILCELKPRDSITIDTALLHRTHDTTPQTTLKRAERLQNITGAFDYNKTTLAAYQDCTIIIIDDVVTTGATLMAARATLEPNLHPTTKIICLALAH